MSDRSMEERVVRWISAVELIELCIVGLSGRKATSARATDHSPERLLYPVEIGRSLHKVNLVEQDDVRRRDLSFRDHELVG